MQFINLTRKKRGGGNYSFKFMDIQEHQNNKITDEIFHLLHEQYPLYPRFLFCGQKLGPLLPKTVQRAEEINKGCTKNYTLTTQLH